MLSAIRGNYKNVLHLNGGAIISSLKQKSFIGGNKGSFLNGAIYQLSYYTRIYEGESITIQLPQIYELNTLKILFKDADYTSYRIKIYIINEKQETLAYDSTARNMFTLKFLDQFVQGFVSEQFSFFLEKNQQLYFLQVKIQLNFINKLNSKNDYMDFLKVEAFYNSKENDEK